jgi:acyl transferase domain-containing protein
VLEEAPAHSLAQDVAGPQLLVLSAKTPHALGQAAQRLKSFLEADTSASIGDVAFTLQTGRRNFAHRQFLVCNSRADAIAGLAARAPASHTSGARRPVVLLLPGVGDHYVGMAHDLYGRFDIFRDELDRCARILEPQLGVDIRKILYPESRSWKSKGERAGIDLKKMLARSADPDSRALNETVHLQPAQFAVEYALAKLWMDLGVAPDALVGHSMGEYVAACLAGVLSLEDALRLIVRRTQLVDRLPRGRMLAVALPEAELAPLLGGALSICLINGPALCVVAGPADAVQELEAKLSAGGAICRPVENTHAFHSRMLDPIVAEFEAEVRKVRLGEPRIAYISNVTGTWVTKAQATDPAYWASHTSHTARFNDALRAMWTLEESILLEAGPGKTLGALAMQHPDRKPGARVVSSLRHHYENRNDVEFLLHGVGALWASGAQIRWDCLHQGRKVSLPTYPFERQEYWIEAGDVDARAGLERWFYVPTWERTLESGSTAPAKAASWLVVGDRSGGFAKKLEQMGAAVQVVRFGEQYRRLADGSLELDPAAPHDYLRLLRELEGALGGELNIVHLGCLGAGARQEHGFYSVLYMAQAIGELGISIPVRLGILSSAVHEVTGEEALEPDMATVLGPAGVIPKELANLACFSVDLSRAQDAEAAAGRILSEFAEPRPGEILAYRGTHRWRRKFERAQLPESSAPRRLRERGVYLITGGTGGIGLAIARLLASACRARIVLTKKTAFPPKARWKEFLDSKEAPKRVVKTLRELMEIERAGAEVEVFAAEASDKEAMRRVIDETIKRFGGINGVFHAAGIVRAGLAQAKSRDAAREVLAPKVEGTRVLHELLAEVDLDFLVLFSSVTSILFPYAESDYAGANAFLDAFAHYSNARRKYRTVSINWPGWREAGQLAELEARPGTERWKEHALEKAILTRDGLQALSRILDSDLPQVVVSPEDLERLIAESRRAFDPKQYLQLGDTPAMSAQPADVDQPGTEIETAVAGIWRDVFGHRSIGIHQEFAALGGHSLIAMQIVARVRSFYRIHLSLRDFFAAPTIARLSAEVEARILREIEGLTDDEAARLTQEIS